MVALHNLALPHLPTRLRGSKCFCVCVYVWVYMFGCVWVRVFVWVHVFAREHFFVMYGCLCIEYACVRVEVYVCVFVGGELVFVGLFFN